MLKLQSLVMHCVFFAIYALTLFPNTAHGSAKFKHKHVAVGVQQQQLARQQEEQELRKRQLILPSPEMVSDSMEALIPRLSSSTSTSTSSDNDNGPASTTFSIYYPSPSASPTPITRQSQVETTYIPIITTCKGPPVAFALSQQTTSTPYRNYTSTIFGKQPITCDTLYDTALTTICATTLVGIANRVTVSRCSQDVTFSSDFGATLVTPRPLRSGSHMAAAVATITPSPSLQLRTTYYLAPWQSLLAAGPGVLPSDVDVKICHPRAGNDTMEDCTRIEETWAVLPVTRTSAYTSAVDVLATLTEGPGNYVVGTVHGAFVGNATVVRLSTQMLLNMMYEAETVSRGPRAGPLATATAATTPYKLLATPAEEAERVPGASATGAGVGQTGVPSAAVESGSGSATSGERGSERGGALPTIHLTSTRTRTRTVVPASTAGEETTTLTDKSTETVYSETPTGTNPALLLVSETDVEGAPVPVSSEVASTSDLMAGSETLLPSMATALPASLSIQESPVEAPETSSMGSVSAADPIVENATPATLLAAESPSTTPVPTTMQIVSAGFRLTASSMSIRWSNSTM